MVICDGNPLQYAKIMEMDINEYLLKLDNWVSQIESKLSK